LIEWGPEFACVAALEHLTRVAGNFPDKIAISDGAANSAIPSF
jgi:hypothetical protein